EVYQQYYNQAFVVMAYFGYLRRDPDALYADWINVLNQSGDSRRMVEGFVYSIEYRYRLKHFGVLPSDAGGTDVRGSAAAHCGKALPFRSISHPPFEAPPHAKIFN